MKGYSTIRELFRISSGILMQEVKCESDNEPALLVSFPSHEGLDDEQYQRAWRYAEQLRNVEGLLLPLLCERETSGGKFAYEMVFEWDDSLRPLTELAKSNEQQLWMLRGVAEILDKLFTRKVGGEFVGGEAIFVDATNYKVRLGFCGFARLFRAHQKGKGDEEVRADWRDDVYRLAKCFSDQIDELPVSDVANVIRDCLAKDKQERPKPAKLLQATHALPKFQPLYEEEVELVFKHGDDADAVLDLLNRTECYHSEWKINDKSQRTCDFWADGYTGCFVNTEGDLHWFVPYIHKTPIKKREKHIVQVLRTRFVKVDYASQRSPDGGYHHLTQLVADKDYEVANWRAVPESEKKFIKENAFRAPYQYAHELRGQKLAFILREGEYQDWRKVQDLKEKEKRLDAMPMHVGEHADKISVGEFDDLKPRKVVEVVSERNDIRAEKGKLQIAGESLSYDFFWAKKKTLCFAIKHGESINTDIADGESVLSEAVMGEIGKFARTYETQEVTTHDYKKQGERPLPSSGKVQEDFWLELVPFNRQVEAVNSFAGNDMVEPQLGKILATPDEHRPSFRPDYSDLSLNFYNKKLSGAQKEAVAGALCQKPLFLIHGPPGTGKTTVIVEIVHQILKAKPSARILVCSQTNLAVDNVLERLPDDETKSAVRKIRLAHKKDRVVKAVQKYYFDDCFDEWRKQAVRTSGENKFMQSERSKLASELSRTLNVAKTPAQRNGINAAIDKWHQVLRDENSEMRANVTDGWSPLKREFLRSHNVIGSTCVHIAASRYREIFQDRYDCLILDEASKATPAETLIPTVRTKQVVLIGDHKQLPPFVTTKKDVWKVIREKNPELEDAEDDSLRKKFGESLFEKLIVAFEDEPSISEFLDIQRRMPLRLGGLISQKFYDGALKNPPEDDYARDKQKGLPRTWRKGVLFIDTSNYESHYDNGEVNARKNQCNAEVVVQSLHTLCKELPRAKNETVVITGYRGQMQLLREKIRLSKCLRGNPEDVVNTVDGFQGRESDIVIYDVVRSAEGGTVGFLDEPRRLNVALSRAKKLLIIVGDAQFLSKRAKPGRDRKAEKKPLLGEIVDQLAEENLIFHSLQGSL